MVKFITEKVRGRVAAVYMMTFDCGRFYIGGSCSVRQRFARWKTVLTGGERKNISITEAYANTKKVKLSVEEIVSDPSMVKIREDEHIKKHWGNPLFLNRSPTAFSSLGTKQSPNRKKSTKRQKVAKVDLVGNVLEVYESIAECESKNGLSRMTRVFKKYGLTIKGNIYRKIDVNGNIITPAMVPKKARPTGVIKYSEEAKKNMKAAAQRRKESGTQHIADGKSVNIYDKDGTFIRTHKSIADAARSVGCKDIKRLRRILSGKRGKSIYGFKFSYA